MRKVQFVNNQYYHIYNRGIDKRIIFEDREDYLKFLRNLKDFNNTSYYEERLGALRSKELSSFLAGLERVVEIVAYSLNPNHFHLILKQFREGGVSNFMHKTGTSFTNYFNKKYNRSGSLFQGPYKTVHINSNDYLLWLSGYINGNVEIHKSGDAEFWPWSSYKSFLGRGKSEILGDINIILSQFTGPEDYKNFTRRVINESRTRREMEEYFLEPIIE